MGSGSRTLQDILETEYPLLDSSLLAAFISDLPSDVDPSHESLQNLRHTLAQLSLNVHAESEVNASFDGPDYSAFGSDEPHASENGVSASTSGASSTSTDATSAVSCTSPLEFLQILFPQISTAVLTQTLQECTDTQDPTDEPDLSGVVDHLLTLEYIQDLAERGLDEEEEDSGPWVTATAKGKQTSPKSKPKPRKYTVSLVDIRQRQYAPKRPVANPTSPSRPSFSEDPWMRLTSLATRLSELLPQNAPGYFMSYFHAPPAQAMKGKAGWKGEGDALRNALSDIATRKASLIDEAAAEVVYNVVLDSDADDVVLLNAEQRARLVSDARLCIAAAHGDSGTAIDLVWLLRDLDDAFYQGDGVAHAIEEKAIPSLGNRAVAPSVRETTSLTPRAPKLTLPSHPPPVLPPPLSQKHPPNTSSGRAVHGWTLVEPRRPAPDTNVHPHAEFIPAYANRKRQAVGRRNGDGLSESNAAELDFRSVDWYKTRASEVQLQRNEALREATRHWQRGNTKSRGGEVALYYAEKARELQEQQKKWALGAARVMVEAKRTTKAALDLHGLTVAEACVIVTEALTATPPTPMCPLKIITGRGRHSVGKIGVLGPAVREMLRSTGWRVGAWDGGLVVRGRL